MNKLTKKIIHAIDSLNQREKIITAVAAFFVLACLIYFPISWVNKSIENTRRDKKIRETQLADIAFLSQRYSQLNAKLNSVEKSFNEAQMTFEQVTSEMDKIIKSSIGKDVDYEFKKPKNPSKLGLEFEKQEFSLALRQTTLEQLVKLLFKLEQGRTPLFLGKIDMRKAGTKNMFSTNLEVFSVRKKQS